MNIHYHVVDVTDLGQHLCQGGAVRGRVRVWVRVRVRFGFGFGLRFGFGFQTGVACSFTARAHTPSPSPLTLTDTALSPSYCPLSSTAQYLTYVPFPRRVSWRRACSRWSWRAECARWRTYDGTVRRTRGSAGHRPVWVHPGCGCSAGSGGGGSAVRNLTAPARRERRVN